MATTSPLPSGVSPPLTTENEFNHSGLIVIATSFYLVLVVWSLGARIFSCSHRRRVQPDDYIFGVLVVRPHDSYRRNHHSLTPVSCTEIVHCNSSNLNGPMASSLWLGNAQGVCKYRWAPIQGKSSSEESNHLLITILKAGYLAELLSILALGLSKISCCVFYETLFSQMRLPFIRGILVGIVAWTVLAIFLSAIRCNSARWYDISSAHCDSLVWIGSLPSTLYRITNRI